MTEETAKRIAAALERLADAKEGKHFVPAGPLMPSIDPQFGIRVCPYCGGPHAGSLPCPKLTGVGTSP